MQPDRLLLLWHFHQPWYFPPDTDRVARLPWVRLHAAKGYLDLLSALARAPKVRAVINLSGSLLRQLERARRGATDRLHRLVSIPPEAWSLADRSEVLARCFSLHHDRLVHPFPPYEALWRKRQGAGAHVQAWTDAELRELLTRYFLAWCGATLRREHPHWQAWRMAECLPSGALAEVAAAMDQAPGRVLDLLRSLSASGQIALSATPYHHPILPLVVDTDVGVPLRNPLRAPQDARWHILESLDTFEEILGCRPDLVWPAEGAVSEGALDLLSAVGVRWAASDELVLERSRGSEARGHDRFSSWRWGGRDGPLHLVFRDHELSDRVGFAYQHWRADHAAADFVKSVRERCRWARSVGVEAPLLAVILDGENPWESYFDDGAPFLAQLFSAMEGAADLVTVLPDAALAEGSAPLQRVHAGSWIDANFRIWIGSRAKDRAWEALGAAAEVVEEAVAAGAAGVERARASLRVAQASDWFWWYGDDFVSAEKAELCALFRGHVAAAYDALGRPVPAQVRRGWEAEGEPAARLVELPTAPPHDPGLPLSTLSWEGAGRLCVRPVEGAMHRSVHLIAGVAYLWSVDGALSLSIRLDRLLRRHGATLWTLRVRGDASGSEALVQWRGLDEALACSVGEALWGDEALLWRLPGGWTSEGRAEGGVWLRVELCEGDALVEGHPVGAAAYVLPWSAGEA